VTGHVTKDDTAAVLSMVNYGGNGKQKICHKDRVAVVETWQI
jgi:hypothetical protein